MVCAGKKRSREERSAQRMQRAALQKAQHSQFVKDLQAEVMDGPQEDAAVGAAAARGTDTLALLKQQQRLEARAAIEEDMMVRMLCAACYDVLGTLWDHSHQSKFSQL